MPEKWTGRLIGRMHNERITYEQLANEMGVNKAYISMILNGKRKPPNIQKRMETALEAIIKREREKQSQKKGEIT
jgi:transcriptional regulator with XRE-family HTH domain|uniref:Regulatory protein n=1 Tax=Siphoviridae sp. ctg8V11 TaxID=2827910 RepID=A0A8S5T4D5_9CAUD|nr:MAG TPA: regulatory protein [Caudoviricetes sp.]DAF57839.1 MAG TPA: Regulatory protein [Siphoviridae sp. ctg8V11]DAM31904.1 MAG TPA: Regulatory protein [Caudoviricetes sp.]DAY44606.1 MAG TPA: Regulatory protein [Caudoviricetes sp.]DAZ77209.1 MAG TPA: regulatory protein [Caudoviricetes sp.]